MNIWSWISAIFCVANMVTYFIAGEAYFVVLGMLWGVLFELSLMDLKLDRLIKMVNFNADG